MSKSSNNKPFWSRMAGRYDFIMEKDAKSVWGHVPADGGGFEGISADFIDEFKEYMGVTFRFGGNDVAPWVNILVLACTAVVFYGLALFNISRKSR